MGAEQIIVGEKLVTVKSRVWKCGSKATNVGGKIISYSSHTNTPGCLLHLRRHGSLSYNSSVIDVHSNAKINAKDPTDATSA